MLFFLLQTCPSTRSTRITRERVAKVQRRTATGIGKSQVKSTREMAEDETTTTRRRNPLEEMIVRKRIDIGREADRDHRTERRNRPLHPVTVEIMMTMSGDLIKITEMIGTAEGTGVVAETVPQSMTITAGETSQAGGMRGPHIPPHRVARTNAGTGDSK